MNGKIGLMDVLRRALEMHHVDVVHKDKEIWRIVTLKREMVVRMRRRA